MEKMKGHTTLWTQLPKPKKIGVGKLSFDRGEAYHFDQNLVSKNQLIRARLETASADGMMLSGLESNGTTKEGQLKYKYQEWWLAYMEEK